MEGPGIELHARVIPKEENPPKLGKKPRVIRTAETQASILLNELKRNPGMGLKRTTTENLSDVVSDDGPPIHGTVRHSTQQVLPMFWKEDGHRVLAPASAFATCLDIGFLTYCPFCGDDCGEEINACPGQPKKHFTRCGICDKTLIDPGEYVPPTGELDEMEIATNILGSTPQRRLEAILRSHMVAYHPAEAEMRGLTGPTAREPEPGLMGRGQVAF